MELAKTADLGGRVDVVCAGPQLCGAARAHHHYYKGPADHCDRSVKPLQGSGNGMPESESCAASRCTPAGLTVRKRRSPREVGSYPQGNPFADSLFPCRPMLPPARQSCALATGNCARHVCAADNLQTSCKQQSLRTYPRQYPATGQRLENCPPAKVPEDAFRSSRTANWTIMRTRLTSLRGIGSRKDRERWHVYAARSCRCARRRLH